MTDPDIQKMVQLLYRRFRRTGIDPLPSGRLALHIVTEGLAHAYVMASLDQMILDRIHQLDYLIHTTQHLLELLNRRRRNSLIIVGFVTITMSLISFILAIQCGLP